MEQSKILKIRCWVFVFGLWTLFSQTAYAFSEGPPKEESRALASKSRKGAPSKQTVPAKDDFRREIKGMAETVNAIQSSKQLYKMLSPELSASEKKAFRKKMAGIKELPRVSQMEKNKFVLSFDGQKYRVTLIDPDNGQFIVNGHRWSWNPEKPMLKQFYNLDTILKMK